METEAITSYHHFTRGPVFNALSVRYVMLEAAEPCPASYKAGTKGLLRTTFDVLKRGGVTVSVRSHFLNVMD